MEKKYLGPFSISLLLTYCFHSQGHLIAQYGCWNKVTSTFQVGSRKKQDRKKKKKNTQIFCFLLTCHDLDLLNVTMFSCKKARTCSLLAGFIAISRNIRVYNESREKCLLGDIQQSLSQRSRFLPSLPRNVII